MNEAEYVMKNYGDLRECYPHGTHKIPMRFVCMARRLNPKEFFSMNESTHKSHWYFAILQIEANIFVLSPITCRLELNGLLIELKI